MTVVSSLKVKVVKKAALKLKVLPKFPSSVSATSPLALDTTGGNYKFSLNVAALETSLAASATIDTTNAANITSGTLPAARLPNPTASTLGGVESIAAVTHNWINSISTSGVPSLSQPAFTDISGSVAASQLPNPSASTLGGVQSALAVSHQWINSISTSGVPALSQPAFSDISGNIAVSQMSSGTSASAATFWRGDGTWASLLGNSAVSGASTTYVAAQANVNVERSNSGSAMADTLPGTSPGVLPANTVIVVTNADASGVLSIKVGAGAVFKTAAASTGYVYLGPGQAARFYSDGSNYWAVDLPSRCKFAADTVIYLNASTGGATNDGLTSSTPLLDPTFAYNLAKNSFDLAGHKITFSHANGTYGQVVMSGPLVGVVAVGTRYSNPDNVVFLGNSATPANVILTTANIFGTIYATNGAMATFNGFQVTNTNTTSGYCILAYQGSQIAFLNMNIGSVAAGMVQIGSLYSSLVSIIGNYSIIAGAGGHIVASGNSVIEVHNPGATTTITLVGTPAFTQAFAIVQYTSLIVIQNAVTFSGSATGSRYLVFLNGVIDTGGGGANFFPGNAIGTNPTGGQYA